MPAAASVVTLSADIRRRPRSVALVGCPNVGKSSLFNALTGLRQKVSNYPGITVERNTGTLTVPAGSVEVVDLPGTYSLLPRSPDERVVIDTLMGRINGDHKPDVIVLVADAAHLQRSLFLLSQVLELRRPVIVALNQVDLAVGAGIEVDPKALSERLRIPVVPTCGRTGGGRAELAAEILRGGGAPQAPLLEFARPFDASVDRLADRFALHFGGADAARAPLRRALGSGGEAQELRDDLLLSGEPGIRALTDAFEAERAALAEAGGDIETSTAQARYVWVESVSAKCERRVGEASPWQRRLDAFLTHPLAGVLTLGAVFTFLFMIVFSWSGPAIDLVDGVVGDFGGWLGGLFGEGLFAGFVQNGLVAGLGAFLVFVPQIAMLFVCIEALDDTGYLARAAFLLDKLMGKAGLPGRAFLPLLSGFACAIPGIMATRAIEDRTDRFVTMAILPLMSCSARLPVYAVVVGALFANQGPWVPSLVVLSMYLLGIALALAGAKILRRTVLTGDRSPLLLELPPYRRPSVRTVLRNTVVRTWSFVRGAGPIIVAFSMLLWVGLTFPRDVDYSRDYPAEIAALESRLESEPEAGRAAIEDELSSLGGKQEAERLAHTYMGRAGKWMEPVSKPLGFDWKMDVAIIGSFAAREVFVPTLGVIYAAGEVDEEDPGLLASMRADTWPDGRKLFTPLSGISLLVFYVIALQCMSTLAVIKRETNSWTWPAGVFAVLTAAAYLASLLVYQVGSLLGFA